MSVRGLVLLGALALTGCAAGAAEDARPAPVTTVGTDPADAPDRRVETFGPPPTP